MKKNSLKYFFASAVITAIVIITPVAAIYAEKNSLSTGVKQVECSFGIDFEGENVTLTVNDRKYRLVKISDKLADVLLYIAPFVFSAMLI